MHLQESIRTLGAHGQGGWEYGMGPGMMGNWGGHGFGWFGFIFMALIIVGIVLCIVFIMRGAGSGWCGRGQRHGEDDAMTTLRRRFANGEISKEEYEERKSALES